MTPKPTLREVSFPVTPLTQTSGGLRVKQDLTSFVTSFVTHQHIWERWTRPWTRSSGQKRTPDGEKAQRV